MKTPICFSIGILLSMATVTLTIAGGYSDNHNDDVLTGWSKVGKRTWSESDGWAVPNSSDQHFRGFLINNYPCAQNGTFTCTIKGSGDQNSLDGGVVFRFSDKSHFYFITLAESNSNGYSEDNMLRLQKNSTEAREHYTVIQNKLDFTGLNSIYTITVRLTGSTFTFWLNNDSLGQYTDTDNPGGSVGYAYDDITNGYISIDSSCWMDKVTDYTWDVSTSTGIQSGNGVWGTHSYWTTNDGYGTALTSWAPGRTATFNGVDGTYAITVYGIQPVDSLAFLNSTYTFSGGVIDLGINSGIFVREDKEVVINSEISGSAGLTKYGEGRLVLTGTNTYDGPTSIIGGTLQIGNDGTTGTIRGPIDNNGALIFKRTDTCTLNENINGTGSVTMEGTGVLMLSGTNSFSGRTIVSSGTLAVDGTIDESEVYIADTAVLAGTGICAGNVLVDGTITPGVSGPGRLSAGTLELSSSSIINIELGTTSDTISVSGGLTLDGTLNIIAGIGFTTGTYRFITCAGEITDNSLDIGSTPEGWDLTFDQKDGYLSVNVTAGLIQTEPDDVVAAVGDTVSFTVSASGAEEFSYKWLRFPSDSVGETSTLSFCVTPADTGTLFRCVVANDYGTDSSRWARLDVIDTPRVAVQPEPQNTPVGSGAVFSVSAVIPTGIIYSWRRVGSDEELGNTDSLRIDAVAFSDSGGLFFCLLSNVMATVSTDTVELTVTHMAPVITGQPKSRTVEVGNSVSFTVSATGNASPSYAWKKTGSSSVLGSDVSYILSEATLMDSGYYYCIVSNPGGTVSSDTVHLTVTSAAPVPAFTFTPKSGAAPLTVEFTDASTGEIDSRHWNYGDGKFDTASDPTHTFSGPGLYTVILIVKGPGGTDSLVKTDSIFVYDEGDNPVRISADLLSGKKIRITFTNIGHIDTLAPAPQCDSMGIWYKPDRLPGSIHDGTLIARYQRRQLKEATITDTVSLPEMPDSVCGLMCGLFWHDGTISDFLDGNGCKVTVHGSVENPPPENPFTLSATAVSSSSIHLKWDCGDDDITHMKVRLWYGITMIDTGMFDGFIEFDSVMVSPAESSAVIAGLTPETEYYFCIQAENGDKWSAVTERSRSSCETPARSADTGGTNPIEIHSLYYDLLTASLKMSWCFDEESEEDVDIGITYGFSDFPTTTAGIYPITLNTQCSGTLIPLREPIRFDTLYYFSLWFRTADGIWLEPTGRSRKTVRTGPPFRQVVTFFDSDTVSAFNDHILILKDGNQQTTDIITDTLEVATFTPPDGMAVVGTPFTLKKGITDFPIGVGFRIRSLPKGMSLNDVRIYYDSCGICRVEHETAIDYFNGIVSVTTGNLKRTFVAMIDKMKPSVTIYSDTGAFIDSTGYTGDSIRISDNITNIRWHYLFNSGDVLPLRHFDGELFTMDTTLSFTIRDSGEFADTDAGLRILLVLDDGPHRDTINLSRSVIRYQSDQCTVSEKRWTPVYATACLKKTNASVLIDQLIKDKEITEYNPKYMRLFRWADYSGNQEDSLKWVEYDPTRKNIRSLFTLDPGVIIWLKTISETAIHLDTGYTLTLKDTFSVTLPAGQWTDFGMPFHFGVSMKDILSASGRNADSIQFYRWEDDTPDGIHFLKPFYVRAMPDRHDPSDILEYLPQGGYSFYNQSSDTVTVRIPPIPPRNADALDKKTVIADGSWSAKFIAQSEKGVSLPGVYFGYAPGVVSGSLPSPPSFTSLRMTVFDQETGGQYGHHISQDASTGLYRKLLITNLADSIQTVRYHFEQVGAFPERYAPFCLDRERNDFTSTGTITIDPSSTASRWIVVGDETYRRNLTQLITAYRFSLHAPYPNPSRSVVNIRYTIPFDAEGTVEITIYNIKGMKIWGKKIKKIHTAGLHTVTWRGDDAHHCPTGSGFYIIRFTVMDKRQHPVQQFTRHITLLR